MIDVVLGGRRQDAQVHVLRPHLGQLQLVQLDDPRHVHLLEIAADALVLLGDGFGRDRVRSGHDFFSASPFERGFQRRLDRITAGTP